MIPIETYYSNIVFSAEGCRDLHGTLIHNEDGPDEIETCWKLSEEELKGKTGLFRERLEKGETLDDILPEAFAAVREAADRVLGLRAYPVQIIGGTFDGVEGTFVKVEKKRKKQVVIQAQGIAAVMITHLDDGYLKVIS